MYPNPKCWWSGSSPIMKSIHSFPSNVDSSLSHWACQKWPEAPQNL